MLRTGTVASLFISAALALGACAIDSSSGAGGKDESAQITSRSGLETYLRTTSPSPIDALSGVAKQRFLDGLVFTTDGLEHLDYAELEGLTPSGISDVLRLFGMETYTQTVLDAAAERAKHPVGDAKPPTLIP